LNAVPAASTDAGVKSSAVLVGVPLSSRIVDMTTATLPVLRTT
jgi:hypothetical protein